MIEIYKWKSGCGGGDGASRWFECGGEVEDVGEVAEVVVIGFLHELVVDHDEDDAAEVVGAEDAPVR